MFRRFDGPGEIDGPAFAPHPAQAKVAFANDLAVVLPLFAVACEVFYPASQQQGFPLRCQDGVRVVGELALDLRVPNFKQLGEHLF